jgi:hypothetical protein
MIQKMSRLDTIKERLRKENEVVLMNQEGHMKAVSNMNKQLEEFRKDTQLKEKNSQISASSVILTKLF